MAPQPIDHANGGPSTLFNFRYPRWKQSEVHRRAKARGMTASEYARKAIDEYMAAEDTDQEVVAEAS
jgi:hypothetical protein